MGEHHAPTAVSVQSQLVHRVAEVSHVSLILMRMLLM